MALVKREEIKQFILASLGYPIVNVELDESMMKVAINTAIDEYLATGAVERDYLMVPSLPGNNAIPLPPEVGTVSSVTYSKPFEMMAGQAGTTDIFSFAMGGGGGFGGLQGAGYGNFTHGSANLAVFYEYTQNRNRTLGLDTTFKVIDNTLYVFPYPKEGQNIIIEYAKNTYGVMDKDGAISTSNQWGVYWIKRMALAQSKNMLGMARGKYSTMAGATGESQTMNYQELHSQAKDEIEKLREDLASHVTHTQFTLA